MTHNDMDNSKELLSATRGNAFGFMFFRILLKCFGVRIAGAFLWPVTFFYALFDRTACRRARPVLECMYPEASVLARFWHTWRLFANQGRVILLANYLSATGKEIPVVTENHPEALPYIQSGDQPVVVVSSHFGAWQAAFINSHLIHRSITFLDHPDQKAMLDKFQTVRAEEGQVAEIAQNQAVAGGLVEAMAALSRNEMVGMMGDRASDANATAVAVGKGTLNLLTSPWLLAARMHAPVIVFLVGLQWSPLKIVCRFSKPFFPPDIPGRRLKPEDLHSGMEFYASELTQMLQRFPDQWFKFEE